MGENTAIRAEFSDRRQTSARYRKDKSCI